MSATETTITVDRSVIEEFVAKVEGAGTFDNLRNSGDTTALCELLYRIAGELRIATLGELTEDEHEALDKRGDAYSDQFFANLVARRKL